jgi:sugar phosphate isomerase/epimerase
MPMKLAISSRIVEKFRDKRQANMGLEELAELSASEGYAALCMRASQLGTQTPIEQVREQYQLLTQRGLQVSMVTGDFPIPENTDEGPQALRNISPYLDLADALECDLMRIAMKTEEDIPWAQRAADEANERGMRLAHQCHTASLFEQVDESLAVLAKVGRPNFGIIYEPANLDLCGQDFGAETIKRLQPHMFNVYLQNHVLHADGETKLTTWCQGEVSFDQVPIWESGGLDFQPVFETLTDIDYTGYVTVHQAFSGLRGPEEAARSSAGWLRSMASFAE